MSKTRRQTKLDKNKSPDMPESQEKSPSVSPPGPQPNQEPEVTPTNDTIMVEVDGFNIPMTPQEFLQFRKEEEDREETRKQKEREFELEKLRVANSQSSKPEDRKIERYHSKLTNQKDPEEFFTAFEHYARREGWDETTWVRRLSQCIEGKALVAMNSVMTDDLDYEQLKRAILEAFQLSPENYRHNFRTMSKSDTENAKTFITRLGHTFDQWVKYSDIEIKSEDAKQIS